MWTEVKRRLRRYPWLVQAVKRVKALPMAGQSVETRFTRIYKENRWADSESASGTGSNLFETTQIRAVLPGLFSSLGVRSVLDAPCGDFNWMRTLAGLLDRYDGLDIVAEIIARNQAAYGSDRIAFRCGNLIADPLPRADMILCRDCLVHLSLSDIFRALRNIKASGATWLATTTFSGPRPNIDIVTGDWRALNLRSAPFNFPEPAASVDERCPTPGFNDKLLAIWRVDQLPG
jgi:SAM-dependent methyltransferase